MGHCLGTAPNTRNVVVRDNTVKGVMPESPKSLERHYLVNTCLNGASEESIDIYAKIRC